MKNARRNGLERSNTDSSEPVAEKNQRLKFAGAILVLGLILFVAAQWPQRDSNAARLTAPQSDGSAEATFVIDYFPAQFDSPAKNNAPEDHIQAF